MTILSRIISKRNKKYLGWGIGFSLYAYVCIPLFTWERYYRWITPRTKPTEL